MMDIQEISTGLKLSDDGIWYARDRQAISYPKDGNENCFLLEDDSFWFMHRNQCITSLVKTYPPLENEAIIDIGGGNGFVSAGLSNAGFDVVLLEPGIVGVKNARKRGLENVICATTDTAGLKQESLSAVGLFDVIEHIEDDSVFLESIGKLIKPQGRLYATVPAYSFLWSEEDVLAGHFRRYTLDGICKALESAGFEVEFASYIFRFLPVPIFLLRTIPYKMGLARTGKSMKNASREHTGGGGGVVTKFLSLLLRGEIENIAANKTMLFGGSCLVTAKRS